MSNLINTQTFIVLTFLNSIYGVWYITIKELDAQKGIRMDLQNFAKIKLKIKDDAEASKLLDAMLDEAKADETKLTETEGKLTKSVESEGKLRTYKQSVNESVGLDKEASRDDSLKKVKESASEITNLKKGVSDKDSELIDIRKTAQDALDQVSNINKTLGEKDAKIIRSDKEKSFRAELTGNGIKDAGSQDLAVNAHLSSLLESDDAGIKEFTKTFAEKNPRLKESGHKGGANSRVGTEQETTGGLKDIKVTDTKARTDAIEARMAENTN